jgi:hypothetical protein
VSGCDSLDNLTLAVSTSVSGYESQTICNGSSFTWNGNSYNQTGNYTVTLTGASVGGCDSIDNLILTVESPIVAANNNAAPFVGDNCGLSFDPTILGVSGGDGNYSYNVISGTSNCNTFPAGTYVPYTINVTDGQNCTAQFNASEVYVDDQFDYTFFSQTDASCPNATNGTYTGTIVDNTNQECAFTWNLTVSGSLTSYYYTTSGSSVGGQITLSGLAPDTYTYTIIGSDLCSPNNGGSFTIGAGGNAPSGTEYDTICYGTSLTWNGTSYNQAGSYTYTISGGSVSGCDSIDNLSLTILPALSSTLYDTISSGGSVQIGTQTYSQTGVYTATITGSYGCDSVVTLNLYVSGSTSVTYTDLFDTICQGGSVTVGNISYSSSGTYIDTLTGSLSSDSVVTLSLTVYPNVSVNLYDTLVTGDTLHLGGQAYSQSGIYYDTLTSTHGCDSIINLYLYVAPASTFANLFDTVCQGFSVVIGNHTYTISGTYVDTLTGTYGGDSIVTLNLVINRALLSNSVDTICQGSSVIVGLHTYSQSGTYVDTLTSVGGCDSIHALELTVLPVVTPSIYISVIHGPLISGMQTDTFTASSADCPDPYYSWYRDIVPLGIHSTVAVVTYPAGTQDSISCEVYCNNECQTVTHAFSNNIYTGINDLIASLQSVDIYPNPTQGTFNMDINASIINSKDAQITVTDMLGQNVLIMPVTLHAGKTHEVISLGEQSVSGIYLIQLTLDGQSLYYRIVLDK